MYYITVAYFSFGWQLAAAASKQGSYTLNNYNGKIIYIYMHT